MTKTKTKPPRTAGGKSATGTASRVVRNAASGLFAFVDAPNAASMGRGDKAETKTTRRLMTTGREKPIVRARIDKSVKEEATAVLASIGLTVSDAFRLMMVRIAEEKALPFEPLIPNADTIEAIKAARRGELTTVGSIDALFADLNADD